MNEDPLTRMYVLMFVICTSSLAASLTSHLDGHVQAKGTGKTASGCVVKPHENGQNSTSSLKGEEQEATQEGEKEAPKTSEESKKGVEKGGEVQAKARPFRWEFQ